MLKPSEMIKKLSGLIELYDPACLPDADAAGQAENTAGIIDADKTDNAANRDDAPRAASGIAIPLNGYFTGAEESIRLKWRDRKSWVTKTDLKRAEERLSGLSEEYANYRRRTQAEKLDICRHERMEITREFLAVYDDLERALTHECTDTVFYDGVQMTMNKLKALLTKLGISEINALGMPFDPALHHAVDSCEDPTAEGEKVVVVYRKGFMLENMPVRFAMVKVACPERRDTDSINVEDINV